MEETNLILTLPSSNNPTEEIEAGALPSPVTYQEKFKLKLRKKRIARYPLVVNAPILLKIYRDVPCHICMNKTHKNCRDLRLHR